jgi:hypothetical protein
MCCRRQVVPLELWTWGISMSYRRAVARSALAFVSFRGAWFILRAVTRIFDSPIAVTVDIAMRSVQSFPFVLNVMAHYMRSLLSR